MKNISKQLTLAILLITVLISWNKDEVIVYNRIKTVNTTIYSSENSSIKEHNVSYTYNRNGYISSATATTEDGVISYKCTYNEEDQLIEETKTSNDSYDIYTYEYDNNGYLEKKRINGDLTTYTYDSKGRLSSENSEYSLKKTYTYSEGLVTENTENSNRYIEYRYSDQSRFNQPRTVPEAVNDTDIQRLFELVSVIFYDFNSNGSFIFITTQTSESVNIDQYCNEIDSYILATTNYTYE